MRAEGVGFEPTRPVAGPIGFQDRRLRPLGHPSVPYRRVLGPRSDTRLVSSAVANVISTSPCSIIGISRKTARPGDIDRQPRL